MRVRKDYDLGPAPLKHNLIDTGDWNMDLTASIDVDVGIAFTRWRHIQVMIRNNVNDVYSSLGVNGQASGYAEHTSGKGATILTLYRGAGGRYDAVGWNSTSYNRGYISLGYH